MRRWWKDLDRILRGETTRPSALRRGTVEVPVGGLLALVIVLGVLYGACMGSFALFRGGGDSGWQILAAAVKVPTLFLLTLAVTFPSLYVFNALVGSRLGVEAVLRLLVAALAVTLAVLASLGPIVAFFSASTTSYPFMVLLNVVIFGVAGTLGLAFLLQTLHRLSLAAGEPRPTEAEEAVGGDKGERSPPSPGALEAAGDRVLGRHVRLVFRCWVVLYGLVGAQMGWVLRPFIGDPRLPFTWFRERRSNFFEAVWRALSSLLS